jgi:hypothetical protein
MDPCSTQPQCGKSMQARTAAYVEHASVDQFTPWDEARETGDSFIYRLFG